MESYVERWEREQKEKKAAAEKKAQRKAQKAQKVQKNSLYGEMQKEVQEDGTDTRSEGHEAQAESNGGE